MNTNLDIGLVRAFALIAETGPDFLAQRPAMAARIAVARGDNKAARDWVEKALAVPNPSLTTRLSIARTLTCIALAASIFPRPSK